MPTKKIEIGRSSHYGSHWWNRNVEFTVITYEIIEYWIDENGDEHVTNVYTQTKEVEESTASN
jgi:hypothetical protein